MDNGLGLFDIVLSDVLSEVETIVDEIFRDFKALLGPLFELACQNRPIRRLVWVIRGHDLHLLRVPFPV